MKSFWEGMFRFVLIGEFNYHETGISESVVEKCWRKKRGGKVGWWKGCSSEISEGESMGKQKKLAFQTVTWGDRISHKVEITVLVVSNEIWHDILAETQQNWLWDCEFVTTAFKWNISDGGGGWRGGSEKFQVSPRGLNFRFPREEKLSPI